MILFCAPDGGALAVAPLRLLLLLRFAVHSKTKRDYGKDNGLKRDLEQGRMAQRGGGASPDGRIAQYTPGSVTTAGSVWSNLNPTHMWAGNQIGASASRASEYHQMGGLRFVKTHCWWASFYRTYTLIYVTYVLSYTGYRLDNVLEKHAWASPAFKRRHVSDFTVCFFFPQKHL